MPERRFHAPRQRESDLLAQAIDDAANDHVAAGALQAAAALIADPWGIGNEGSTH
jgi:hypothetical protein